MTIAEARQIAKKWQEILGLSHWKIDVRWAKKSDKMDDYHGLIWWYTEEARAEIALNRKLADEETILHEEVHLAFEGHLPQPKDYDRLYEQSINRLVKVLISVRAA